MNSTIRPEAGNGKRHSVTTARRPRRLHLEMTDSRVALITFDHPDKSANIFDGMTLYELDIALRAVEKLPAKGLVFLSAKPAVFIAGADLEVLNDAVNGKGKEDLTALVERGQALFSRIARLGIPTVAAIHGACVGGGLELALACDRRLASDDSSTRLGLPETLLGILPAWGGSTRLPRLIGLPKALDLILAGKLLAPKHALKLGLVDEVVPRERLRSRALALLNEPLPERPSHHFTNNGLSAIVIRLLAGRRLRRKTRGHYPAVLEALEVVSRGASGDERASFAREAAAFSRLARTDAARNLMRVHFLQEHSKRFRYDESVNPRSLVPVHTTAVIGAGVMGAGIAQWFAAKNHPVILRDLDTERVAAGVKSITRLFDEAVAKRILSRHEAGRKLDLVTPSATPVRLHRCDLVVEAAVENLEVKMKIFADLAGRTSPGTILATNTSALPITALCTAEGVSHPERIIGLHFFNPVSRMKLVEVVVTEFTSPETVERTLAFVRSIGKLPVVVKDSPGFLVNRILMPYLIEAGRMVDAGMDAAKVDEAMLNFGMPMGPLRLLDEVGLDVASHVAATMENAFGDRFAVPAVLSRLVADGHLGKKSGRGFYHYGGRKKGALPGGGGLASQPSSVEIAARLAGLMVTEAERCLAEGIVANSDDIDLAMILGTGFAPFRGGPLAYAASVRATTKPANHLIVPFT
jgi:3-hydroxyacyl-CoA dehydrogenase / enoyl-CoA hydratase / 3-hydroxybutyryl-CoA epimerase